MSFFLAFIISIYSISDQEYDKYELILHQAYDFIIAQSYMVAQYGDISCIF